MTVTDPPSATVSTSSADPGPVLGLLGGVTAYWVLAAALKVGLFEALHAGVDDIAALADRCGADAGRLEVLCAALCDQGLVQASGDRWLPTVAAEAFLTADAGRPLGGLVLHGPGRHENLPALADVVRGATPPRPVDEDGAFWADLFDATFSTQRALSMATARAGAVPDTKVGGLRSIELGPAAGAWSIGLLEARADAVATVETLPAVLQRLASAARRHGVDGRLLTAAPSGAGNADVVILANAVRLSSREGAQALISQAANRLAPGGVLIDADYFTDADGRAGAAARLMAATMLANTREGRAYTEAEHLAWLGAAGLAPELRLEPLPGFPVLLARRPVPPTPSERRA